MNRMYRDGVITKCMKPYLTFVNPKAGSLTGNPKLHKRGAPFRTIVSGINTLTEKTAKVAEYELQEYVLGSSSYIRDTIDFINKLKDIDEPSFFVLMIANYIRPSQMKRSLQLVRRHWRQEQRP